MSTPKAATFATAIPDWLKPKDQLTSLVHSAVNPSTFVVPERPAVPAFGAPSARVATEPASFSSVPTPGHETQDDVASRPNVSHRHSAASWSLTVPDAPDASHRVPSHNNDAIAHSDVSPDFELRKTIAGQQAHGPPAQPIGDFSLADIAPEPPRHPFYFPCRLSTAHHSDSPRFAHHTPPERCLSRSAGV